MRAQQEVSAGCAGRCVSDEKAGRRKLEWRAPSSYLEKELQLKLSKVAGTMNIVTKCVHF